VFGRGLGDLGLLALELIARFVVADDRWAFVKKHPLDVLPSCCLSYVRFGCCACSRCSTC